MLRCLSCVSLAGIRPPGLHRTDSLPFNSAASQPDCQCDSGLLGTGLPHGPGRTGLSPSLRSGLGPAFLLPTPVCPAASQRLPDSRKGWRGGPASRCQCHDSFWVSCRLERGGRTLCKFLKPLSNCHPVVLGAWWHLSLQPGTARDMFISRVRPRCLGWPQRTVLGFWYSSVGTTVVRNPW